jgi:hypothetical protein
MRKIFTLFFILSVFLYGSFANAQDAGNKPTSRVIVYYFHGNLRCHTCYTMEQYSKETIQGNFKGALSSGKLEFKAVNVEERENEHFAQDYQLYTKALILSLVKDDKEIKSKNLAKIWEYAFNKQRFFDYVNEEVNNFLKEAS